jgi:serine/threonine protein phosphatase PrpC
VAWFLYLQPVDGQAAGHNQGSKLMEWQVVAKSVIGVSHIKKEKPCQDYCDYSLEEDNQVIIGAVSDGLGSKRHSDIGSKIAVSSAIKFLRQKKVWELGSYESGLKIAFEEAFQNILHKLGEEAHTSNYSIEELACTLIMFVATPKWLAAIQIGDGQIVVGSSKTQYILLFKPKKDGYVNETDSVTDENALQLMKFSLSHVSYEFICAATDGIENISISKNKTWEPFSKFFDGLLDLISSSNKSLPEKEKEVEDFLNRQDINEKTDDDKTLLLCAYGNFSSTGNAIVKSERKNHTSSEETKQIVDEIKNLILQIQESSKVSPLVSMRKGVLELTFKTDKPLKFFQPLVDRIQEVLNENRHVKLPPAIKKVVVFNEIISTGEIQDRGEFNLTSSVLSSPILVRILAVTFFIIVSLVTSMQFFKMRIPQAPNQQYSPDSNQN